MNTRMLALLVALACAPLCAPAWALDLSQAYQAAMEQDATIRATRAATAAKRERLPQARSQLLPNLSASASRNRNSLESTTPNFLGQSVTTNTNYNSSSEALTLRQPLFRKYQMADYRQAQAQVDDANAVLERELQNVAVRVSGAYFEALLTAEQLALVVAQKAAYSSQFDAAKKRFAAGAGTRTDIDEAQAALDLNVAQELEARQNVDFTRRQLQTLINRPIDTLASLNADKMELVPPLPNRIEDWAERAEANSPEIRSLKAQVEVAHYEVEKAQAGHYPTLDAIAQWSRNESDTVTSVNNRYTNRSIGLQLNIPIFSGGNVNSAVRQALADKERAEEALEALRRDLGVRVHHEFRGVTEGVLKVQALEQAVRSTEQVAMSNRRAFEAGSRTLIDTLNAEQQKVSAQRDLAQARFVYLISRVRLQALAGGHKTEVIDEINGWLMR
ncbi:outer membrane protein, protease secretion system [Polaromonas sp. OV174]|uniref:TolC family outer membrane protein n=1 Tax=Polaromonas sp. OV174 TaxID=1855300 RepID=UPI0008F1B2F3|nr:TolC family outer membrane protein [Polaromonas sp. OV174]SFC17033.1 outer membrane protein, protease secretion system [Polaromonas sp. OV174]